MRRNRGASVLVEMDVEGFSVYCPKICTKSAKQDIAIEDYVDLLRSGGADVVLLAFRCARCGKGVVGKRRRVERTSLYTVPAGPKL